MVSFCHYSGSSDQTGPLLFYVQTPIVRSNPCCLFSFRKSCGFLSWDTISLPAPKLYSLGSTSPVSLFGTVQCCTFPSLFSLTAPSVHSCCSQYIHKGLQYVHKGLLHKGLTLYLCDVKDFFKLAAYTQAGIFTVC